MVLVRDRGMVLVRDRGMVLVRDRGMVLVRDRGMVLVRDRGMVLVRDRGMVLVRDRGMVIVRDRGMVLVHLFNFAHPPPPFPCWWGIHVYRINVCSNSIGDAGLCRLADALKRNSAVSIVLIWGNNIGEPTCNVGHTQHICLCHYNTCSHAAAHEIIAGNW